MARKNWLVLIAVATIAAVAGLVFLGTFLRPHSAGREATPPDADVALRNLTVRIDGESFPMSDGVSAIAVPDSAATNVLRLVGEPVLSSGSAARPGDREAALLVVNDPGGSGSFYYAVLAVPADGSYRTTNVLPLGDRIKPESVEYRDGRFVYRFLDRKPGQPMSEPPSVEKTVRIALDRTSNRISSDS